MKKSILALSVCSLSLLILCGCTNSSKTTNVESTALEEETTIAEVEEDYLVEFIGKETQPEEEYNTICDYCKLYYTFTNNTDNMVKGIQGTFHAYDMFGDEIFVSNNCKLTFNDDRIYGKGSYNDYILLGVSGQDKLAIRKIYDMDFKDMKLSLDIEK